MKYLVLLIALFFAAPAFAQDAEVPMVGCGSVEGGGGCSIYFLELGWPKLVGVNAAEFVKFEFGAGMTGAYAREDISYLGGICLIPKIGDVPICPQD